MKTSEKTNICLRWTNVCFFDIVNILLNVNIYDTIICFREKKDHADLQCNYFIKC